MREGLKNGATELARILSQDLQGAAPTASLRRVMVAQGREADLLAERNGGQLLLYPDGSLRFVIAIAPSQAAPAAPVAAATPGAR